MDREKLEKEADRWTHFYNTEMKTEPVPYDERFKKGFIKGTDWLMQQPLTERLTDEEKEIYRNMYQSLSEGIYAANKSVGCYPNFGLFGMKLKQEMLISIFGTALFNEK